MGMFDWIEGVPEMPCPKCGRPLDSWQSKDGPCEMERLHFSEVDNFYTLCSDRCGEFVEFALPKPPRVPRPFEDYQRVNSFEGLDGGEEGMTNLVVDLEEP